MEGNNDTQQSEASSTMRTLDLYLDSLVTVVIHKGELKKGTDANGLSDMFVVLGGKEKTHKTPVQRNTLKPIFEEVWSTTIQWLEDPFILIYDEDVLSNEFIGRGNVKIEKENGRLKSIARQKVDIISKKGHVKGWIELSAWAGRHNSICKPAEIRLFEVDIGPSPL
eukprot:TRINITY_DN6165_c1_g1_i3.p1 TRINITY_DN6165_c1_g1~~TRINITY_DN6165_c1_g1_i3.p1  ORF type:complete len:167 (-),score=24.93 TRINITY_DN6165_c1_g1_i3:56-556(-)